MPADLIPAPQAPRAENKSERHTRVRGETSQANLSTALNLLGSIPAWPPGGARTMGNCRRPGLRCLKLRDSGGSRGGRSPSILGGGRER